MKNSEVTSKQRAACSSCGAVGVCVHDGASTLMAEIERLSRELAAERGLREGSVLALTADNDRLRAALDLIAAGSYGQPYCVRVAREALGAADEPSAGPAAAQAIESAAGPEIRRVGGFGLRSCLGSLGRAQMTVMNKRASCPCGYPCLATDCPRRSAVSEKESL